jgi:hypothetical protein
MYTINLPPVQWVEVILHFAEVFQGAFELGKHVFDVFIQGKEVAYHFDIYLKGRELVEQLTF